ncbi:MAG: MYXO-CTERM sorting domain-containing protein [Polyangiaceae bacterium]|nr:MYXO-CTERM sorting domain-containing protein [Polyangiaceae bacterium]
MLKKLLLCGSLAAGVLSAAPSTTHAHPVTVDGAATEWFTRLPSGDNLGLVARDAQGQGEYIWRDALADTRTDISTPEVVADIAAFQVTGDAMGVGFLIRRAPGVNLAGAPIQVQIAVDTDLMDGSGQEFFAEFGDTKVANGARWERLIETLFGSGGTAKVIDTGFNQVAMVSAMQGATGDIEIFVPWSALGLMAPPTTPLRFTVATFRCQANQDLTIDIGGPMFSNALDVISDYGDPVAAMFPNTYQDVQDLIVDYSFDVHFRANGEVYTPLVVQRFLANSLAGAQGPDEWYSVTNVSPGMVALGGIKLGDEETPDGNEGMFAFPAMNLASGATFTVARAGASYQAFFAKAPDAELPPGATMAVPDMIPFVQWTANVAGATQLANGGDEVILLDRSNTLIDIAVFGNGVYPGITPFTPAPGTNQVLSRDAMSSDTDSCQVDFSNAGTTCTADAQCGGTCKACVNNTCVNKPMGAACPNANPCDGDEICDGAGLCVPNPAPICDDANPCTTDTCTPANGCTHTPLANGATCSDGDVCNGAETCSAGMCTQGMPLTCDDMDPCTVDACDPVMGCSNTDAPEGTPCSDGDLCNGTETCDAAGLCQPGTQLDCDDQNPCTVDACAAATGCEYMDVADGSACSDGDLCNGDEQCSAGACVSGNAPDCDDQNACTLDTCEPSTGCTHTNEPAGAACDDGNGCTEPDTCDGNGQCVAGPDGCGGSGGTGGTGGGSTTSSSSSTTTTGAGGGDGGGGTGGDQLDDGGCGCRTAGSSNQSNLAWLAALGLTLALVRRRRDR